MEDNQPIRNPLCRKIDQKIKKTGYDNNFIAACVFHLEKIYHHYEDTAMLFDVQLSQLFMEKIEMYPEKKFKCEINENSAWPVPLVPTELFAPLPGSYRISSFYDFLEPGNVLDCRVTSVQPSKYMLRVVNKYGNTQILGDLNISAKLMRCSNSSPMKKNYLPCELIRVAVQKITKETEGKPTVYVTLDNSNLTEIKLGKINEENLPSYVLDPPDPEKYSSYSCYLKSMPEFQNPTLLDEFFSGFGINHKKIYSFFKDLNGLTCSHENTGISLLNKSRLTDAKKLSALSKQDYDLGNNERALENINKALELCPKKDLLKTSLYSMRGDINKTNKNWKEAVYDYIISYTFNSTNNETVKKLSKVLFGIANVFYRQKEYQKAFLYAESSLDVHKNNNSSRLIQHLQEKHGEDLDKRIVDLDKKSLAELHKKKKKLETQLEKSYK